MTALQATTTLDEVIAVVALLACLTTRHSRRCILYNNVNIERLPGSFGAAGAYNLATA